MTEIRSKYKTGPAREFAFATIGDSLTQKQFAAECNINNIMAKYKKTGMWSHVNQSNGVFGDFSNAEDYLTSVSKVMDASAQFDALPSHIRSKFDNDPAKLIGFLSDEKNRDEAIKIGLIPKPDPTAPSLKDQMVEALAENDVKRAKSKKSE